MFPTNRSCETLSLQILLNAKLEKKKMKKKVEFEQFGSSFFSSFFSYLELKQSATGKFKIYSKFS